MKTKILFFIFLTMLLTACDAHVAFNTDTDEVIRTADKIADFDLPNGYRPEFSASFEEYTMVAYKPGDNHSHLYLIQSQNPADAQKLEQELNHIMPGTKDRDTRMTVLETHSITVRGQEATLIVSEGTNGDGELYRQVTLVFASKGGPALLAFSQPVTTWDSIQWQALIASIQ